MKLAVTLTEEASIKPLIDAGADVFILGIEGLTHRMNHTFDLKTLSNIVKQLKESGKEIYISINRIIHDEHIEILKHAIESIKDLELDGIIFTDLAVFMHAEKNDLTNKLIYAPETYSTHSYDIAFWRNENIKAVVLSREVLIEDIEKIAKKASLPILFYGHGYVNMFHSRRPLLENFFKHTKDADPDTIKDRRNLTIVEEIRDEHYPIYQDYYGTHIFREKPRQSFTVIERLKNVLSVFVVDSILMDEKQFITAVKDYRKALDNTVTNELIEKYQNDYDEGFYFKRTQSVKGESL